MHQMIYNVIQQKNGIMQQSEIIMHQINIMQYNAMKEQFQFQHIMQQIIYRIMHHYEMSQPLRMIYTAS